MIKSFDYTLSKTKVAHKILYDIKEGLNRINILTIWAFREIEPFC